MAEWSKALASGAIPREGWGEPRTCHFEVAAQIRVRPLLFAAEMLAHFQERFAHRIRQQYISNKPG